MSDIKQLPTRDQVNSELTWDLTPIFQNQQAFEQAFDGVMKQIDALPELEGKMAHSSDDLVKVIETIMNTIRPAEKLYVYASLKHDQDTSNAENQALSGRTQNMFTKLESNIAWFEPELLAIEPATLNQWIETEPALKPYEHYLHTITDERAHVLTPAAEKLLAQAGDALSASSNTFGVLNDADLEFPSG